MRNIKLTIQYDGTSYSGWQAQKNGRSIQGTVEKALRKITGCSTSLTGSGRTDAGVHAAGQIANFRTRSAIPLKNLQMALNTALPKDIVIKACEEAGASFDAQRSAKAKLYRYTIANNDFVDPFMRRYAAKCFFKLDIGGMRKAARFLVGKKDFRSFQASGSGAKSTIRAVKKIKIEKNGDLVYIDIEADGFLYNMVRNIVGTLIEVGRGKIPASEVEKILKEKDRRSCGPTAAAKGLCLIKVGYK